MNVLSRKFNLIETLIFLQDKKILEKIEAFVSSFKIPDQKPLLKKTGKEASYKNKIRSVSVWTEKDVEEMEKNLKKFNEWSIKNW